MDDRAWGSVRVAVLGMRRDDRGANLVEYLIVLGCIAILALGGWSRFGASVHDKLVGQAECIATWSGCEGHPQGADPGNGPAAGGAPEPVESSAPATYEDVLRDSLQTLADNFSTLAGDDGRIDEDDLEDALGSSNPDVRAAAQFFLDNPSALNALDVGQGDGDIDGDISREDIAGLQESLNDASLATLLADTANGEGGRDGDVSRDDLEALLEDQGVPQSVRDWAAVRLAEMPEDEGGCSGWSDFSCHIGNAGSWAYDVSGLDSVVDHSGLDSAAAWVDENIYQNLPGPVRGLWDFYYGFQVLGPVRLVTGLVDGVGGILSLGQTYGENLIEDPWGTLTATAEFATNPQAQAEFAWNLGSAIVQDYAERCPSSATEAGACTFEVALEVALALTTGGSGNAASHTDDLRYLRYVDDVDDATDAIRIIDRIEDLRPHGWQDVNLGGGPANTVRDLNCTRCAAAVDATLDGAPASALAIDPANVPSFEEFSRLIRRSPEAWQHASSQAAAETIVEGWGHGSKGIVVIDRADGTAHAFNVINDRGTILFLDGQTGALASFDEVTYVRVVRTNDWAIE
ncbi:MAG: toxin glutamine deamidase domain-containing protein [Polyangiaceae bacterium]